MHGDLENATSVMRSWTNKYYTRFTLAQLFIGYFSSKTAKVSSLGNWDSLFEQCKELIPKLV